MNRLIILLMLISCRGFAQTADDIINKHFEATGGKDKWSKVTSISYSGNYVMGPGMLAPVNGIVSSKPFKGSYFDFSWQGMTSKRVMRGDSGWTYNPFGGKRETDPLSPDDIRAIKLTADPQGLLFNYKEKGYTLDYLGTDDMDGTDVYKLRLTNKDGDMVYYYIDMDTYYILQMTTRIKLKDREEKTATVFSDFRKTDYGIIVPFAPSGNAIKYTKVVVNGPVNAAQFDKPK